MNFCDYFLIPAIIRGFAGLLAAGTLFPVTGVFVLRFNLYTFRFTIMHAVILAGALAIALQIDLLATSLAAYHNNANVTFRNVTSSGKITFAIANAANGWAGLTTTYYYPSTGTIDNSAIQYNNYYLKNDTASELSYTIYHEIGHALGLAHEHQRADSSNQFGQGTPGIAVLIKAEATAYGLSFPVLKTVYKKPPRPLYRS